jgi:calcineurin-like phosphoesterase family protein
MIFFTADLHYGHKNILKYTNRPYETIESMDQDYIGRWNKRVKHSDTVYHLGDFTMLGEVGAIRYFNVLNGHISIVPGGHDKRWITDVGKQEIISKSGHLIKTLPPLVTVEFSILGDKGLEKKPIVLCHYAMRVWDRSHYGSWHLFGHSHGMLPSYHNSLDVGVDTFPDLVSLEELPELMGRTNP